MVLNDEMVLIKVVRLEKTSIKIGSAKSQLSKIAVNGPKMDKKWPLLKKVNNIYMLSIT